MRTDLFSEKKCVHFKIDKDVHHALRAKLFKHNISMQELFDEFARLVATDTVKGQSVIDLIVNRKIKEAMLSTEGKVRKRKKKESFGNLDSETLYNMINGSDES
jgi:hypothetical protein